MKRRIFTFFSLVFLSALVSGVSAQICNPTPGQTFTNSTPVTIPTTTGVVTSTITVAGAPAYLYDVNARTFIQHTFASDLDVTITSPAGTVVTLTTDNGAGNDNVFNGTIWDDDANPGGQVPYTSQQGIASEHTYTNNVVATTLVPEEAMGAFIGENPNGVWTLTISDDASGDGGTATWSLTIQGLTLAPTATTTSASNTTPVTVPTTVGVVNSTINVAGAGLHTIKVTVTTNLTHTFNADVDMTLRSPSGTVVTLTTDNGGANDNVFNGTLWDDDANPAGQVPYTSNNGLASDALYTNNVVMTTLVPEEAMGAFVGENPNGVWTLTISDDLGGDGGAVTWSINVTTITCPPPFVACDQNFDGVIAPALPTGWSASTPTDCAGSDPWATSTAGVPAPAFVSGPNAAFVNAPNCISDEVLESHEFKVTSTTSTVTFQNNYNLESTYDGMVLEISIAGGAYQDILAAGGSFVTGGYNGTIDLGFGSPIAGRQAWTGSSAGFITSTANLPAAADGQWVRLRWRRATDNSVTSQGVRIDDVSFTATNCACEIVCPANITVSNDPNQCGAIVNYPAPVSHGSCGSITASPASGSFFPVGTTTVLVSDGIASCTFTITVTDTQPPTITCPGAITVSNNPGVCGANVSFSATVSDNCPGVTVAYSPASGSLFPVGTTTVTATATDASGNTATCSFTVTVNDTEQPTFGSPAPMPDRLYYKFDGSGTTVPNLATAPPAGTATATINGNLTQGSTGKCGQALIGTGTADARMNTGWATNMTTPWTIGFWLGPNQVDANPSYLFGDVTAGSFRAFYGGAAGPNTVLVRGGSADISITGVNPGATFITIVYNGTNTTVYRNGGSPQVFPVTFGSNSGAGPFYVGGYSNAGAFSISGRMDEFAMYSRALSAGEVLALFSDCPGGGAVCPSNITVNNAPGTCGAVVNYTAPVGVDNCPGVTTAQTTGLPSGATYPVGVTTNTFVATDASGNTRTCVFTVTVVDNQNPVITCPANMTVTTPIGSCTATVNYTVTSSDNCPGVTQQLISGLPSGSAFPLGVNSVTWRATDASGNTSQCTFTITVLDGQLPVISQQPVNTNSCVGSNTTFSVVSSNVLTYQWQTFSGGTWNNIPGATSSTYTVNNVTTAMNTNTFRVILTGLCTTVTSNMATLFVNTLPAISLTSSLPPFLLPGQSLDITATGMPPGGSYQWFLNGSPIPGATGNVLTGITLNEQGSYTVRYTSPLGCVQTSAVLLVTGAASENIWVFPNPNFGQFTVRFYNTNPEEATVNVYNSKGQKVHSRQMTTTLPYTNIDIDLGPNVPNGVYFVELVNGNGNRVGARQVVVRPN